MNHWTVPSHYHGKTLLSFLKKQLETDLSGRALKKALEANCCRVNRQIERFASIKLAAGDIVEWTGDWEPKKNPVDFPVIYEDEWIKIIDKPANWISQGHLLIHRLDKDTTGLLLFAKSEKVREAFVQLFKEQKVEKTYLAFVDGCMQKEKGKIEIALQKKGSFQGQTIWGSGRRGLYALTYWKRLGYTRNATLVECEPKTGRTHQLRVHLAEIGHPILNDRQYAKHYRCKHLFPRPLLHARRLSFIHPVSNERIEVFSPIPDDFLEAASTLLIKFS